MSPAVHNAWFAQESNLGTRNARQWYFVLKIAKANHLHKGNKDCLGLPDSLRNADHSAIKYLSGQSFVHDQGH